MGEVNLINKCVCLLHLFWRLLLIIEEWSSTMQAVKAALQEFILKVHSA